MCRDSKNLTLRSFVYSHFYLKLSEFDKWIIMQGPHPLWETWKTIYSCIASPTLFRHIIQHYKWGKIHQYLQKEKVPCRQSADLEWTRSLMAPEKIPSATVRLMIQKSKLAGKTHLCEGFHYYGSKLEI